MRAAGTDSAGPAYATRAGGGDFAVVRYRHLWLIYLTAGVLVIVGYRFLPEGLGSDAVFVTIGVSAVTALIIGVRMHQPTRTLPWILMAVGQLLWVSGDAINGYIAHGLQLEAFPTVADPIYLTAYPVLALALYLLVRRRLPRGDWAGLLDSLIVTASFGLLAWVFMAQPTLVQYAESPLSAAVAVAYPVGDILLIAVLIRLLTTPGGRTPAMRLLLVAVVSQVLADTLSTALGQLTYASNRAFDPLWLMSYLTWGAAALHPSMYSLSAPTQGAAIGLSRQRFVALTVAVMVAPLTLALQHVAGADVVLWPYIVGSVLLFALVMTRMHEAIRQILRVDSEREQLQADLAHQAAHDPLTDLANRAQLSRMLRGALARAQRSGGIVGLLYVDLDGFKAVNDTLGHGAGDEVLRSVADRMQSEVREGDVVARLGGDEFVVLLESLDEQTSAVTVANRLVDVIGAPIAVNTGRQVQVGASIGVALSQDGQLDPEVLLHEADVAVYRAKSAGRGRTEVFDAALRRELNERSSVEKAMNAALAQGDLELRYTPVLELVSGEIRWFSAAVHWQNGAELVPPDAFLPMASKLDLISEVDGWAIREAARRLGMWRSRPDVGIVLHISARRLSRPALGAEVAKALTASDVPAERLVVEVSEASLGESLVVRENLADLHAQGVLLAVSGFGAGRSLDSGIAGLSLDLARIDCRLGQGSPESDERLLRLLVQTAHAFGLRVLADGVVDLAQLRRIEQLGCSAAQGPVVSPELGTLAATASLDRSWTSPI